MISFRKFWEYLDKNNITQYQLINVNGISRGTLDRLRKNEKIDTTTIERLCDILGCQPGDIMENLPADEVKDKAPSTRKGGRKKKTEK